MRTRTQFETFRDAFASAGIPVQHYSLKGSPARFLHFMNTIFIFENEDLVEIVQGQCWEPYALGLRAIRGRERSALVAAPSQE